MIVTLPRSPEVSSVAREAVRLLAWQLGARRNADACLLVSELVTNAYLHGRGQIRLRITLHEHVARFAVCDEGRAILRPSAHPGEDGGWGLNIVARVADHWGTDVEPTHVWFELHAPLLRPLAAASPAPTSSSRRAAFERYSPDDTTVTAARRRGSSS